MAETNREPGGSAVVKEFWMIVECPRCLRPQAVSKWVKSNTIYSLNSDRSYTCSICDYEFRIYLETEKDNGTSE